MMFHVVRKLVVLALIGLLVGCAPWGDPEPVVHTWEAQPVLITLSNGPGFMQEDRAWEVMPRLVVYADGTVITAHYDNGERGRPDALEQAHLTSEEVCALLGQVADTGFFDLDAADYEAPDTMHAGTVTLKVDAWRSNQVSAYALPYALGAPDSGVEQVEVPEALATTYHLLRGYTPAGGVLYQPERVVLRITRLRYELEAPPWPLPSISLAALAKAERRGATEVMLDGAQAVAVYGLPAADIVMAYTEGPSTYAVAVRPLLPLETWRERNPWRDVPAFQEMPKQSLTCRTGA